ncbi:MAG: NosD domain-containing protein, partial [Promethearchaeota archaeon]
SNNSLTENTVKNNTDDGIYLDTSEKNHLSGNFASDNGGNGIYLKLSIDNTLSGNTAYKNIKSGMYLYLRNHNNSITGNILNNNTQYGIYLNNRNNDSTIFGNDIFDNQNAQALEETECFNNQWDNGSIGNYWGQNYSTKYPLATNDGFIWDTPYEIDGDGLGVDHFPLVRAPLFTHKPEDFSADEGYTGLTVYWTVTDLHPTNYSIELDGTEVVSPTTWASGLVITYEVSNGMLQGDYNLTLFVFDEDGNMAQDTVILTINAIETSDDSTDDTNDGAGDGFNWQWGVGLGAAGAALIGVYMYRKKKKG